MWVPLARRSAQPWAPTPGAGCGQLVRKVLVSEGVISGCFYGFFRRLLSRLKERNGMGGRAPWLGGRSEDERRIWGGLFRWRVRPTELARAARCEIGQFDGYNKLCGYFTDHACLARRRLGGSSLVTAQRLTVSKQANDSEMRRRHRETADGKSVGIKMRERHASKGSMSQPTWGPFHCYQ